MWITLKHRTNEDHLENVVYVVESVNPPWGGCHYCTPLLNSSPELAPSSPHEGEVLSNSSEEELNQESKQKLNPNKLEGKQIIKRGKHQPIWKNTSRNKKTLGQVVRKEPRSSKNQGGPNSSKGGIPRSSSKWWKSFPRNCRGMGT